jgi:cytochrome P450
MLDRLRDRYGRHRLIDFFTPSDPSVPGPRQRYPLQYAFRLATDKLRLFSDMAAHGDVSQIRIGPQDVALFNHPDDIKRVLVTEQRNFTKGFALSRTELLLGRGLLTNEGEQHLRQRRLMQPAFHRERIVHYGNVMASHARRLRDSWQHDQRVDMHDAMMKLTLSIAGRTLFDVDVEQDANDIGSALDLSLRLFNYSILPLGELFERSPIPWVRETHRAIRRMDEIIQRMIDERRAHPRAERGDVLSILLAAQDTEGDGAGMDDTQLRDEVVTLLLAGHETTANWLTWTWYLLSQHPDVERALHAELDAVLGGRPAVVSDIPRLDYTRRVLTESMRLYPPAWSMERRALKDFEVRGHRIREGALVIMLQWLVHRDARWWREPGRFNPDRWIGDESDAARRKFTYFPFGAGTRVCIGEHFAWEEAIIVLATLAQHWQAQYVGDSPPVPNPQVTLRPRGGLPVRLRRRASAAGTSPEQVE